MRVLVHARFFPLLLCAALSAVAPACYATGSGGYVDVAYAPANYAAYPSYYYDGANVYYVDGRWYRYDRGHWGYYRSEPRELYTYRSRGYVAPRAHYHGDNRYRTYSAPPARHEVYRAPPARQEVYRAPPARQEVYRAPPRRDDRRYSAPPRRDDHHYQAPSRDDRRRHHD